MTGVMTDLLLLSVFCLSSTRSGCSSTCLDLFFLYVWLQGSAALLDRCGRDLRSPFQRLARLIGVYRHNVSTSQILPDETSGRHCVRYLSCSHSCPFLLGKRSHTSHLCSLCCDPDNVYGTLLPIPDMLLHVATREVTNTVMT